MVPVGILIDDGTGGAAWSLRDETGVEGETIEVMFKAEEALLVAEAGRRASLRAIVETAAGLLSSGVAIGGRLVGIVA